MNIEKHATVALPPEVAAELGYLISATKAAPAGGFESVAELLRHVAISIADGSRRPGSWERWIAGQWIYHSFFARSDARG